MALISGMRQHSLLSTVRHKEVDCTFDVVVEDGQKFLQLDTYGSKERQIPGKKSQSLRLSPAAIAQLKKIIIEHGL